MSEAAVAQIHEWLTVVKCKPLNRGCGHRRGLGRFSEGQKQTLTATVMAMRLFQNGDVQILGNELAS